MISYLDAHGKISKCIKSCVNEDQLYSCSNMIKTFDLKYKINRNNHYSRIHNKTIDYLIDDLKEKLEFKMLKIIYSSHIKEDRIRKHNLCKN